MRVLYVLRYFPTLTETFVYREIDALRARGVEVTIAALGEREDGALQDALPDAPVLRVPRRPLAGRLSRPSAGQRWLTTVQRDKDAARLPWLARRAAGFDRVHVHFAGEAAEVARALHLDLGLPYSVTTHAVDLFKPRPSLDTVLADADPVVTIARHHQDLLAARGHRAALVRCGPDLSAWADLPPPPPGPLRALFLGRDVPKKGLDVLLAAWRGLDRPDARLVLVSDRDAPGIPGVVARGLLPPSQVQAEVAAANLLALPCRPAPDGDLDGVPVALMESLAAGRPVLAGMVSGVPELVDAEVGWPVPPDDAAAVCAALREACDDQAARSRRGRAGPARLRQRGFTLDAQADGLLDLWQGGAS